MIFVVLSNEKVKEMEHFFAMRGKPLIVRTLKQSIERTKINAKWLDPIRNEKGFVECVQELAYAKY